MFRLLLLAALAAVLAFPASAQSPTDPVVTVYRTSDAVSARQAAGAYPLVIGGAETSRVLAVASDAAGNAYVTGDFQGTIDLDPGPGVICSHQPRAGRHLGGVLHCGWGLTLGLHRREFPE